MSFVFVLQYDEAIASALHKLSAKASFKGQLDVYRFCDNVSAAVLMPLLSIEQRFPPF